MKAAFKNKSILITGGTGSFGNKCIGVLLKKYRPKKIVVFSRDELKQYELSKIYGQEDYPIRFFIGDIRDKRSVEQAMRGCDSLIHLASLISIPYSFFAEFIVLRVSSKFKPTVCIYSLIEFILGLEYSSDLFKASSLVIYFSLTI